MARISRTFEVSGEIVVPLWADGKIVGVLDIDSPITDRFDEEDKAGLERFASILEMGCNWTL
jgi:GAF domain-containing protein